MSNLDTPDLNLYDVTTHAPGPVGRLPLQADWLRSSPSGDVFGWTQDAGMGWNPDQLGHPEFLILSTQGGIRMADGTPIALGYHIGHWEVGLLAQAASEEFAQLGAIPFAGFVSDPCDGRTQGTPGMMDSLAYRNDAAIIMRRLIRSLPTRRGVLGIATCDKGLPAMMMALAAQRSLRHTRRSHSRITWLGSSIPGVVFSISRRWNFVFSPGRMYLSIRPPLPL